MSFCLYYTILPFRKQEGARRFLLCLPQSKKTSGIKPEVASYITLKLGEAFCAIRANIFAFENLNASCVSAKYAGRLVLLQNDGIVALCVYLKRIALYIAAVLFSAAMVFYIGYHIYVGLTSDIKTEAASETSRSSVVRADAYIFRAEETVPRTGAGKLIPEAADSSHVAAGSAVAGIYTDSASADGELISTLKSQIKLLKSH